MQNSLIKNVVIVGGGTAGWMTAAALSTVLRDKYTIRVVESDEIGIVGVGEATIPMIQRFNQVLGIDENEFLRETQGTFKLGIEFVNWGKLGDRYIHGFGTIGQDLFTVRFDQYWQKMRSLGKAKDLGEYSITRMAALANKFMPPRLDVPNSPLNQIAYAYHFDASLYSRFLRKFSEPRGVKRIEGRIVQVSQRETDGHIDAVVLDSGERIEGDLFIDCSGFRGLLIEQTLNTGYEDWTHWLPCDRALAVPCESAPKLTPYTRSTAHKAGWQWRIPLQHRIGNGHVYCSQFTSDDEAAATLLANLDGKPLADPRMLKFNTGMRKLGWNRNVVAIGLSSGFLEPLESTSIHLIQSAISRLIDFFPNQGFNQTEINEYNRQSRFEYERIRDFVILHYKLNQRDDAAFWKSCAEMPVPETLAHKMELFKSSGRLLRVDNELFAEVGWLQVLEGQNLKTESYHSLVDLQTETDILEYMESVREVIAKCVEVMPDHAAYIAHHCAAKSGI
ncbi:tryptophan 7-halogenase [Undibacterium sp. Jales W-56]|uniref:tryptophan halogenase family protein n=1 Tax=Undibacterium sp. Jales W-56 TaxID=2897325 RepID=UPI0021D20C35|nr:tryptophan halogenase family protein [Undibacterium sp. Jales W-56]MCU6434519.1 tryptophan 7-halogenase [Undibacterium sp. Jales W-56]